MPLITILLSLSDQVLLSLNRYKTIFLFFLTITCILNYPYINMPPVWDTVAVFSPAIYLYNHNLDYANLLKQEGYLYGGPNIHSLSIITIITYFFISIAKGNTAFLFVALHIIQYLFTALLLTSTYIFTCRLFEWRVAILITIAILFYPLFLVQTGYLYTEIPGAALFMCSISAWVSRNFIVSVLLAILACMVKSFGVVLVCALVFLFLIDMALSKREKLMGVAIMIFFMVGIEMLKWASLATGSTFERSKFFGYLISVFAKLNFLPDLKLFVVVSLIMPCVFGIMQKPNKVSVTETFSRLVNGNISQRSLVTIYLIPFVFVSFIITLPLSGEPLFPLLRYYTWILPLIFIGTIYACNYFLISALRYHKYYSNNKANSVLIFLLIVLISFFIANRDGRFYPTLDGDLNSFSSAERSYEYLDFYKIQRESVIRLTALQNGLPAFVTRGEYYYLSSPLMGYVKKQCRNIFLIVNQPYNSSIIDNFPNDFLLLDVSTQPFHGGNVVKEILRQARANPVYSVSELTQQRSGPYSSSIYRITRHSQSFR